MDPFSLYLGFAIKNNSWWRPLSVSLKGGLIQEKAMYFRISNIILVSDCNLHAVVQQLFSFGTSISQSTVFLIQDQY